MAKAAVPYDPATLRFYSDQAPVYTASGPQGASRHLAAFLDRLRPGARILELGCGGGRDAETMIRRGFNVELTDGTPEIAAQAEERTRRPVRIMRFDQLDALEAYDAVWAHACLLHVPRDALCGILARIFRALRPGALHFASFKTGEKDGRDPFGRYFNYLALAELLELYRSSAPWEIVETTEYGGGYNKRIGPWAAVTVRRPLG